MCFPSTCRRSLCITLSPPKGGSKREFFLFGVAFNVFVAGNHRHFTFGMWLNVASPSLQMTNVPKIGADTSREQFLVPLRYIWNGLSERLQI